MLYFGSLQNVQGHRVNRVTPDHAQTLILTLNLALTLTLNTNPIRKPKSPNPITNPVHPGSLPVRFVVTVYFYLALNVEYLQHLRCRLTGEIGVNLDNAMPTMLHAGSAARHSIRAELLGLCQSALRTCLIACNLDQAL